jgi:hypothetical protein
MSRATLEYELESEMEGEFEWEGEWESEWEGEWESEWEGEYEAEEFFGRLASLARRAARSPMLRRVGLAAARTALGGLGSLGAAVGGQIGGAQGAALGRRLGSSAGRSLAGRLPQSEFEFEGEYEGEYEWEFEEELNPIRRVYPDAMMEHLGHAATEAENEAEAEAFIGALVPMAARLVPRVAPTIMRSAPQLIRGLAGVTRMLRRSPATRQLVRTLPQVVRRTAASIAQQSAQGRPVTPQTAVRTLARQTARVVGSPQQAVQAYRRSRALDQRHHQAVGPAAAVRRGPAA